MHNPQMHTLKEGIDDIIPVFINLPSECRFYSSLSLLCNNQPGEVFISPDLCVDPLRHHLLLSAFYCSYSTFQWETVNEQILIRVIIKLKGFLARHLAVHCFYCKIWPFSCQVCDRFPVCANAPHKYFVLILR